MDARESHRNVHIGFHSSDCSSVSSTGLVIAVRRSAQRVGSMGISGTKSSSSSSSSSSSFSSFCSFNAAFLSFSVAVEEVIVTAVLGP